MKNHPDVLQKADGRIRKKATSRELHERGTLRRGTEFKSVRQKETEKLET